jgi:phosphohistidine phosphatase
MKSILLMRHAKAEPGVPGQADFDRTLAARGRQDSARMGKTLVKLDAVPDAVVSSTAARAKETAEIVAAAMKFRGTIRMERTLYEAGGDAWIDALRKIPASMESALLVAHSPGIEDAASLLCASGEGVFDVPTAGLLAFGADIERWSKLEPGACALRWFLRPKLVEAL